MNFQCCVYYSIMYVVSISCCFVFLIDTSLIFLYYFFWVFFVKNANFLSKDFLLFSFFCRFSTFVFFFVVLFGLSLMIEAFVLK